MPACNGITCEEHEEAVVKPIVSMANDIKWLRSIGTWWFAVVGGLVVLLFPLMVTLMVWLAGIDRRLSIVEAKLFDANHGQSQGGKNNARD